MSIKNLITCNLLIQTNLPQMQMKVLCGKNRFNKICLAYVGETFMSEGKHFQFHLHKIFLPTFTDIIVKIVLHQIGSVLYPQLRALNAKYSENSLSSTSILSLTILSSLLFSSGTRQSSSRSDNSAGHVNHSSKYSELSATRGIHQGDRCLVWSVCCLRLLCSPGVRSRQLCFKVREGVNYYYYDNGLKPGDSVPCPYEPHSKTLGSYVKLNSKNLINSLILKFKL